MAEKAFYAVVGGLVVLLIPVGLVSLYGWAVGGGEKINGGVTK